MPGVQLTSWRSVISIGDEDDTVRECARAAPMSIQIAAGPGFNLRGWPGGGGYLGAAIYS
jgi:hypothetical protein